jgi:hypothetical protein
VIILPFGVSMVPFLRFEWFRQHPKPTIADKVAIITGASTHMGLATAKRFVQEGMHHVFITGRRKDALGWSGNSGRRREPERP